MGDMNVGWVGCGGGWFDLRSVRQKRQDLVGGGH